MTLNVTINADEDVHSVARKFARVTLAYCAQTPSTVPASKVTTVTATDKHGRILETMTTEFPERRIDLNAVARQTFEALASKMRKLDEDYGTEYGAYLTAISPLLGKRSVLARLKALANSSDKEGFWLRADIWQRHTHATPHKQHHAMANNYVSSGQR
jgi:hypothetical protein